MSITINTLFTFLSVMVLSLLFSTHTYAVDAPNCENLIGHESRVFKWDPMEYGGTPFICANGCLYRPPVVSLCFVNSGECSSTFKATGESCDPNKTDGLYPEEGYDRVDPEDDLNDNGIPDGDEDFDGDGLPNSVDDDPFKHFDSLVDNNENGIPDQLEQWLDELTPTINVSEIQCTNFACTNELPIIASNMRTIAASNKDLADAIKAIAMNIITTTDLNSYNSGITNAIRNQNYKFDKLRDSNTAQLEQIKNELREIKSDGIPSPDITLNGGFEDADRATLSSVFSATNNLAAYSQVHSNLITAVLQQMGYIETTLNNTAQDAAHQTKDLLNQSGVKLNKTQSNQLRNASNKANNINNSVNYIKGVVNDNSSKLDAIDSKLDKLDTILTRTTDNQTSLESIDSKLDGLDNGAEFEVLQARIDAVDTFLQAMDAKIDALDNGETDGDGDDNATCKEEEKVDGKCPPKAPETSLGDIDDTLEGIDKGIDGVKGSIDAVNGTLRGIKNLLGGRNEFQKPDGQNETFQNGFLISTEQTLEITSDIESLQLELRNEYEKVKDLFKINTDNFQDGQYQDHSLDLTINGKQHSFKSGVFAALVDNAGIIKAIVMFVFAMLAIRMLGNE